MSTFYNFSFCAGHKMQGAGSVNVHGWRCNCTTFRN